MSGGSHSKWWGILNQGYGHDILPFVIVVCKAVRITDPVISDPVFFRFGKRSGRAIALPALVPALASSSGPWMYLCSVFPANANCNRVPERSRQFIVICIILVFFMKE
jgi:hypothetical protein